jgi:hypothetical protein
LNLRKAYIDKPMRMAYNKNWVLSVTVGGKSLHLRRASRVQCPSERRAVNMKDIMTAIYYVAKLLIDLIEEHKKSRPSHKR